jgi:hypothetical protein
MTTIMKIEEQAKKGTIMNIKENFHIYQSLLMMAHRGRNMSRF